MQGRMTAASWLILMAAFYIGFLSGTGKLGSYDFWWHLETGQMIVDQGAIPHTDSFSHTRSGANWITHEWAYDVLLYLVYRAGDWLAIIYLKALLAGLCAVLAVYLALRWGAGLLAALLSGSLMSVAVTIWLNARPQLLVLLYVLILLHLLLSYRQGRFRVLWWLPILFLAWANSHGSFLLGWGIIVLFGLCQALAPEPINLREGLPRPRLSVLLPLVGPGLASVFICLVNPHGLAGALYPFTYLFGENAYHSQVITEYASPDFHNPVFTALEVLLLLTVLVMILSPRAPSLLEIALLLVGTHMFLKWARNGSLLAAFCVPLFAYHLSEWTRRIRWLRWLGDPQLGVEGLRPQVIAAGAGMLLLSLAFLTPRDGSAPQTLALSLMPSEATEIVRLNHFQGNMFNTYRWGGYLIWNLWPQHRVFIDGRADMYGTRMLKDYQKVVKLKPGWRTLLQRHEVEWLLLKAKSALAVVLTEDTDYARVYEDDTAVLFVRRSGPNRRLMGLAEVNALRRPLGRAEPRR